MQVILIRHGQSQANDINNGKYTMFTGQLDCELAESGKEQARKLRGQAVLDGVERYFVSDLIRTRQTAGYFADPEKIILDARLRERSLGDFEGKYVEDIMADPRYEKYFRDPEYMNFRHSFTAKAPNGENYADVTARITSFWDEIKDKGYKKIVIVAHHGAIQCLMHVLTGISEEETFKVRVPTCTPIIVEV